MISLLAPRDRRDRERHDLVGRLDSDVHAAEQQGFDLDAVLDVELAEPPRPEAYYDLSALDDVIRRPALLPPGVAAEKLSSRDYKYSAPGMSEPLRVTTDPDYFDQHASSVELWSPGSPLFPSSVDGAVKAVTPPRRLSDIVKQSDSE